MGRSDAPSIIRSRNATCPIKNVTVKNLKINGKDAKDAAAANMNIQNAEVTFQ